MADVTVLGEPQEMTDRQAAEFARLKEAGVDELTAVQIATGEFEDLIGVDEQ